MKMSAAQTAADAPILAALTAACLLQPGDSLTVIKMREYCKLNGSTVPGVLSCVCLFDPENWAYYYFSYICPFGLHQPN